MRERRSEKARRIGRSMVRSATAVMAAAGLTTLGTPDAIGAPAATARATVTPAVPLAYHGNDGRIAFVHKGDIFSLVFAATPPFARSLKRLTTKGHASGPRWSPDGNQLAYLYRGRLWIMSANGSHKRQVTRGTPAVFDARPSWSPNGRYLAFVRTTRHQAFGFLTRYDTVTHRSVTFTDVINGKHVQVAALPSAVAWAWALNANRTPTYRSFIVFEGAGAQCGKPSMFCLDALAFAKQSEYRSGALHPELLNTTPTRLTDPDWFPVKPKVNADVMTTVLDCSVPPCTHVGLSPRIGAKVPTSLIGAYEGVYSPNGGYIAFVQVAGTGPKIFAALIPLIGDFRPIFLTAGTEPDWQPRLLPHSARRIGAMTATAARRAVPRSYIGSDGRIAFVRTGNIFSVKPNGRGLRQLTRSGGASGPRWSPTGAQLAYLDRGNLWIMNADGSHKTQITRSAPSSSISRPSWSPNGAFLAFVKTRRHHQAGLLTMYDTSRHLLATFGDASGAITARPAPVAWSQANDGHGNTSFIVYEGAGPRCVTPMRYCLDIVAYPVPSDTASGSTSTEYASTTRIRLTGPDWSPSGAALPPLSGNILTTMENCAFSPCKHSGLLLTIPTAHPPVPVLPGAYEGVYAPLGASIAFVRNRRGVPYLYTGVANQGSVSGVVRLVRGTQPDWQPVAPFPP
jgi:Tol biopolymer transport system component